MIGPRRSIPPSSSCTKATRARSEERIPLPGIYFEAGKNRFRKRSAQFTRGRARFQVASTDYSSNRASTRRARWIVRSGRLSRVEHTKGEEESGFSLFLSPFSIHSSFIRTRFESIRISNIGNHLARSVGKITPINRCFPPDDAITARRKLNRGKIRRSRTTRCVATDGVERWSVDVTSVVEKLSGV